MFSAILLFALASPEYAPALAPDELVNGCHECTWYGLCYWHGLDQGGAPVMPAVLGSQIFTAKATLDAAPVLTASHGRPVARAVRAVARPIHRAKGLIRRLPVLRRFGSCGLRGCR